MTRSGASLRDRVDAAISALGRTHPRVIPLRVELAEGLIVHGLPEEGLAMLGALVAECTAELGPHHETTLVLANNHAMKLAELGRPEGLSRLEALVPAARELWGPLDRRTVLLRSNVAAATGMAGRFGEAIAQLEALLAEPALDDDVVATLRTNLASWCSRIES